MYIYGSMVFLKDKQKGNESFYGGELGEGVREKA